MEKKIIRKDSLWYRYLKMWDSYKLSQCKTDCDYRALSLSVILASLVTVAIGSVILLSLAIIIPILIHGIYIFIFNMVLGLDLVTLDGVEFFLWKFQREDGWITLIPIVCTLLASLVIYKDEIKDYFRGKSYEAEQKGKYVTIRSMYKSFKDKICHPIEFK